LKPPTHFSLFLLSRYLPVITHKKMSENMKRKAPETKPNDANAEDSLSALMLEVRRSAYRGARSIIPNGRHDVIQDIVSWALLTIASRRANPKAKVILKPTSYAYRIARREALHWIQHEQKVISFEAIHAPNVEPINVGVSEKDIAEGIVEPAIVIRQELVEALPELFERFQEKVLGQLSDEDKRFFQLYFLDRLPQEKLAEALGVQPKSVIQRWRRLLISMHKGLLSELCSWALGRDLYFDILRDHDRAAEFLCLLRLFIQEGFEAVKALIDSIGSR
jgi:RNA polymerase sigma factor (sigma-70 family)